MSRWPAWLFGVVLVGTLGGAGEIAGQETHRFDVVIAKDSYAFDPKMIVVEVGDTVRWRNEDVRRHLTASIPGSGSSDHLEIFCEELYAGTTCSHTFAQPGRYPYFCFIHNRMQGEVVVVDH